MKNKLVLGIALAVATACSSSSRSPAATSSSTSSTGDTSGSGTASGTVTVSSTNGSGPGGGDALGPASTGPEQCGIFIRGVNNSTLTSAVLAIKSVSVEVNGAAVDVDTSEMQVPDLAQDVSWRVGAIPQLAAGTTALITITFEVNGSWASTLGTGAILGWTSPLQFEAIAEGTALRDHVVAHVDVDRSFIAGCAWKQVSDDGCGAPASCDGQLAFLPDFGIHY